MLVLQKSWFCATIHLWMYLYHPKVNPKRNLEESVVLNSSRDSSMLSISGMFAVSLGCSLYDSSDMYMIETIANEHVCCLLNMHW